MQNTFNGYQYPEKISQQIKPLFISNPEKEAINTRKEIELIVNASFEQDEINIFNKALCFACGVVLVVPTLIYLF